MNINKGSEIAAEYGKYIDMIKISSVYSGLSISMPKKISFFTIFPVIYKQAYGIKAR